MPDKIKDSKNVTSRIGEDFSKEIEEIKEERLKRGIDKKRKSTRILTNLIVTHSGWPNIKEDTIKENLKEKKEWKIKKEVQ